TRPPETYTLSLHDALPIWATKSVSELTSTTAALAPAVTTPTRPSAATRSAFLAALARPRVRSQSIAASMSPLVSARAFLQSIIRSEEHTSELQSRENLVCR